MNKLLIRDSFFATISVFLVGGIIKLVMILHFSFLDPVHAAVHHVKEEYENLVTDMAGGKVTYNPIGDSDIYLVNADTLDRAGIARLIRQIEKWNPKVIGVDIAFNKQGGQRDTTLVRALNAIREKLVIGTFYSVDRMGQLTGKVTSSDSVYRVGREGYTNFVSASSNEVVRSFLPFKYDSEKGDNLTPEPSFALAIVERYDKKAYDEFVTHRSNLDKSAPETLIYQRNTDGYASYEPEDIFNDSLSFDEFKGKIVLLGYLGSVEDRHYSSFNPDGDRADMNGMAIHANIIEMVLEGDVAHHLSKFTLWAISFVTCFLMMIFLNIQFVKHHLTFHVVFKLVQFASSVIIFAIGLGVFYAFQLRVETLIIIAPIALSVDVLYFYDSFVQWLHRRFGYRTYFTSAHGH